MYYTSKTGIQGLNLNASIYTYEHLSSQFILNKGASKSLINAVETTLTKKLPQAYKDFLEIYDGCVLFKVDDVAGFEFLGTTKILTENQFQKSNFEVDWDDHIILFCLCAGDNEYIGFKLHESGYAIVHCIMEFSPSAWQIVGDSFDVFVNRLLEEKGKKYWL